MELFPAILIGGPPHSGKSVLAYNLTRMLRQHHIEHYLLRACPDGEGDWSNEIDQARVKTIRVKGEWTSEWVERIRRDISKRHLPLLVDVGGRPNKEQEVIFSSCTHAVLIAPTLDSLAEWRTLAERNGLTVLAELNSTLDGTDAVDQITPTLRATIAGLERGALITGLAIQALYKKLEPYLKYSEDELRQLHLNAAPAEMVIDLHQLQRSLNAGEKWAPEQLPEILNYLPEKTPLAVYGRGPNWLYAAIALQPYPAQLYQFDPRLGWIVPPQLQPTSNYQNPTLRIEQSKRPNVLKLDFAVADSYLDYANMENAQVPEIIDVQRLIIGGKIPHWFLTGLCLAYRTVPVLAVYQPQVGCVIVRSQLPEYTIGDTLTWS